MTGTGLSAARAPRAALAVALHAAGFLGALLLVFLTFSLGALMAPEPAAAALHRLSYHVVPRACGAGGCLPVSWWLAVWLPAALGFGVAAARRPPAHRVLLALGMIGAVMLAMAALLPPAGYAVVVPAR